MRRHRPPSDIRTDEPLWRHGVVMDAGQAWADVPLCGGLRDRHAGGIQARRPRHERVGHSVQLEWPARCEEAARRLHQGIVRRPDEHDGAGERRKDTRHAAIDWHRDVHPDRGARHAGQYQRAWRDWRRIDRVLRRARAGGPHERRARRRTSQWPARPGRGIPARAADSDDD